jgi:hypothetical protein
MTEVTIADSFKSPLQILRKGLAIVDGSSWLGDFYEGETWRYNRYKIHHNIDVMAAIYDSANRTFDCKIAITTSVTELLNRESLDALWPSYVAGNDVVKAPLLMPAPILVQRSVHPMHADLQKRFFRMRGL